jgi:hypothetical protein
MSMMFRIRREGRALDESTKGALSCFMQDSGSIEIAICVRTR